MTPLREHSIARVSLRTHRLTRSGFTLLELLLTSLLSAVLLAGLWSLFNTYMQLFETGQTKTEQSQLVRALAQQLADDLHSVVFSPPGGESNFSASVNVAAATTNSPDSATSSVPGLPDDSLVSGNHAVMSRLSATPTSLPHLGLIGTSHTLKLEILQTVLNDNTLQDEPLEDPAGGARTPEVPERRTVLYTFEESREVRETDRKAPPGLVRIDLDWRDFLERSTKSRRSGKSTATSGTEAALIEAIESIGLTSTSAFESLPESSWIHVPEVVFCEFRYFDGSTWMEEWDSRSRKLLPTAVEVTMQINPPPERWKPRASKKNEEDSVQHELPEGPKNKTEGMQRTLESQRPVYRQVIALMPSSIGVHRRATAGETGFGHAGSLLHDSTRRGSR